ncbi:sugar ABC transporter ATP-binding protein [Pedobacter immunditicola]|uniref:sugar ABC transporter ATP-binding protein n=1 Tax=Pedobacter immunditicola TaxID=3133440 RepID=UPI00309DC258
MLVIENISKSFSGVKALQDISLCVLPGKVTAIIGENGAGKSTLMKILSGVYPEYEGKIIYNGRVVRFNNPKEAQKAGIAIIHQELNLVAELSIAENIFLGRELVTPWGTLDKKSMRQQTNLLLQKLKLNKDADTLISDLKIGQQQVVEIAKALLTAAEVIIMDEPTSAISDSEVAVLFTIIEELRKENKALIYISHKVDELFKIADCYVVLRDGRLIETGEMSAVDPDDLIHKMVGREIVMMQKSGLCQGEEQLLSVKNLKLRNAGRASEYLLKDINFSLNKGEVLGIFGLMGAGRTELLETLFGLHAKMSDGEICVSGQPCKMKSPGDAIKCGIALVPEDRKKDGLILGLDVQQNIGITTLNGMEKLGLLSFRSECELSDGYISDLKIKTSSGKQIAQTLSGGNQQKIVIAKWLATKPKILLLDEPTRGIDIHAKNEIYKLIIKLAEEGMGIIVVSSELPEILAISDKVMVMAEGCITAKYLINEASERIILKAAIPKTI